MNENIQGTSNILRDRPQNLSTLQKSSDIVKYRSFGILPSKSVLWLPDSQKSIFLTAIQLSAPLPISVLLSNDDTDFFSFKIMEAFNTISHQFPSPYKLPANTPLMISTSGEKISCNIFGAISASQLDYNGRADFTNVNNVVGLANGSLASLNSGLVVQTRGRIVLEYNMMPSDYDYLEIERVVIKYYCRLNLTLAVGVSSMILSWRPNSQANWIELQEMNLSLIGSINYLNNPIEFDITDMVLESSDPWEIINNLQTGFVGSHTGLGLGNIIQLDATEIEICMAGKNQITVLGYEA